MLGLTCYIFNLVLLAFISCQLHMICILFSCCLLILFTLPTKSQLDHPIESVLICYCVILLIPLFMSVCFPCSQASWSSAMLTNGCALPSFQNLLFCLVLSNFSFSEPLVCTPCAFEPLKPDGQLAHVRIIFAFHKQSVVRSQAKKYLILLIHDNTCCMNPLFFINSWHQVVVPVVQHHLLCHHLSCFPPNHGTEWLGASSSGGWSVESRITSQQR